MMTPEQETPLAVKVYSERDADLGALRGATIAVIGYGNQGHAHALNLRDSGLKVLVGQRPDGPGWRRAVGDDFAPLPIAQAVKQSDFTILALPDMAAPAAYREHIEPHLSAGQALGFIHGFNIHYKQIQPRDDIDVIMVAPKGAGYMVRRAFQYGRGLPAMVAVEQDASGKALQKALSWATGIGAGRAGIIEATFAAETETDLFGEQVSVVGGVTALMKTAFEVLIEAGYEPEHAYFECVHEVKFVVDLIHSHGLSGMREHISDTAEYGDLTRNPRIAEAVKPLMQQILAEIRSGRFAEEWIAEDRAGRPRASKLLESERASLLEETGRRVRALGSAPADA